MCYRRNIIIYPPQNRPGQVCQDARDKFIAEHGKDAKCDHPRRGRNPITNECFCMDCGQEHCPKCKGTTFTEYRGGLSCANPLCGHIIMEDADDDPLSAH